MVTGRLTMADAPARVIFENDRIVPSARIADGRVSTSRQATQNLRAGT
jgi:hypothetical protein